jgi:hypothetical protein
MPVSVSENLGVDKARFDRTGAFDAILDVDSRLFIDSHLVRNTEAPELASSYEKIGQRFDDVIRLLVMNRRPGDPFWRRASALLSFPEVKGLCIGYSSSSTSGSGMGQELRGQLLLTAKAIIDAGIQDPRIFELMGLLEPGIGADRISDMMAHIIIEDLLKYSERIFGDLGTTTRVYTRKGHEYRLVPNPHNRWPIILVPRDVLRDLPVAHSWSDIDRVQTINEEVRRRVNEAIGSTWKQAVRIPKPQLRDFLLRNPDVLRSLLDAYKEKPAIRYDFERDPAGQVAWYWATRRVTKQDPLTLTLSPVPTPEEVLEVVLVICNKFKDLVENNKLSALLYDNGKAKHEEAAQLVFYGVAESYCEANNLDLTRETNAGRGPVDFKVSRGYKNRVVVETKLNTNNRLIHGFEKQIREYQKAEKTKYAVYIVIDVGGPKSRIENLKRIIDDYKKEENRMPEVIFVDANPKAPASKFS